MGGIFTLGRPFRHTDVVMMLERAILPECSSFGCKFQLQQPKR
jgi:hypothetical protein